MHKLTGIPHIGLSIRKYRRRLRHAAGFPGGNPPHIPPELAVNCFAPINLTGTMPPVAAMDMPVGRANFLLG